MLKGMKHHVFMVGQGYGYGDMLCLLSSAQSLKELDPDIEITFLTKHPEVLNNQPGVDNVYHIGNALKLWETHCKKDSIIYTFPYWEITGRMRDLPDTLLNTFRKVVSLPPATSFPIYRLGENDIQLAIDLKEGLEGTMIVVQRGRGRPIKLIELDVMEEIVLMLNGMGYDCVQIGYSYDERVDGCVDLRDQLSFRESMAVMKEAKFIVGHDSMPTHASGIVETPGIFFYGPTSPVDFGYAHNENIFSGVCSQDDKAPCGRPAPWHYDYVSDGKGGYEDWTCPNKTCMNVIDSDFVKMRVIALEARIECGIDFTPRRAVLEKFEL